MKREKRNLAEIVFGSNEKATTRQSPGFDAVVVVGVAVTIFVFWACFDGRMLWNSTSIPGEGSASLCLKWGCGW